jgi:hypothetical protein
LSNTFISFYLFQIQEYHQQEFEFKFEDYINDLLQKDLDDFDFDPNLFAVNN